MAGQRYPIPVSLSAPLGKLGAVRGLFNSGRVDTHLMVLISVSPTACFYIKETTGSRAHRFPKSYLGLALKVTRWMKHNHLGMTAVSSCLNYNCHLCIPGKLWTVDLPRASVGTKGEGRQEAHCIRGIIRSIWLHNLTYFFIAECKIVLSYLFFFLTGW
ncbi:Hypothetical predicted protein [Podarcis lilfordi]|uniref:Uncharacterized protein n=1 Tax=Podarcis lilfordi TaxID=74358 RepID=A0AA35PCQ0_9SAUR|nr:Hypothetical predicted protein [Podarcis lilfordi]